jgi:alpha-N-arabinofuranosidase
MYHTYYYLPYDSGMVLLPVISDSMKYTRLFFLLVMLLSAGAYAQNTVRLNINQSDTGVVISRNIYGQFAEHLGRSIYDGIFRNGEIRMDVVNALKKIRVPNLRWPGGCFADQYHWRDGIGDKRKRPSTVNNTWGMVKEDNSFGTGEFLELCDLIGCEPYIAGNVGTGSPEEMASWIEYLNLNEGSTLSDLRKSSGHAQPYKVAFWGVGNESWGCGGNMEPEYYASLYKHFATFCQNYPGAPLKKIISGANGDDYHWTEVMMKNISINQAWGMSLHYYTIPTGKWEAKGSATRFTESEYAHTMKEALRMDEIVSKNEKIMDRYDPDKKMALLVDEWGVWTDAEPGTNPAFLYQQSSMRDALIAATTLNIFNNHAARVRVANLAQTVNVIQSVILTQGDKMLLTPTYQVFDLYKVHQDATLLGINIHSPEYINGRDSIASVNVSASRDSDGVVHISLVNLDPVKPVTLTAMIKAKAVTGQLLTSEKLTDINTFEQPDKLVIRNFTAFKLKGGELSVVLPSKSVVVLELK